MRLFQNTVHIRYLIRRYISIHMRKSIYNIGGIHDGFFQTPTEARQWIGSHFGLYAQVPRVFFIERIHASLRRHEIFNVFRLVQTVCVLGQDKFHLLATGIFRIRVLFLFAQTSSRVRLLLLLLLLFVFFLAATVVVYVFSMKSEGRSPKFWGRNYLLSSPPNRLITVQHGKHGDYFCYLVCVRALGNWNQLRIRAICGYCCQSGI